MQFATLGQTGLIVSKLCFGTMTFGINAGIPALNKVDQDQAAQMIKRAMDAGINFFDTADGYANGQSEQMLGALVRGFRDDIVIATKVGFRTGGPITQSGLSRRHILSACEASLKRLGSNYIDLYVVHKEDPFTPLEETLEALNELVRSGKVRYIGFSNWSAWKAATALQLQRANGWAQFTSGQMHYSLLCRDVEYDVAPFMRFSGLGMTIWSPLAGGFLSGKYTPENIKDGDHRHAAFDIVPFDHDHGFKLVETIRAVARRHNASVADISIAWLLAKPVVTSVIVGASKMTQLEANLNSVGVQLSKSDIDELDAATQTLPVYPHSFNRRVLDSAQANAIGQLD